MDDHDGLELVITIARTRSQEGSELGLDAKSPSGGSLLRSDSHSMMVTVMAATCGAHVVEMILEPPVMRRVVGNAMPDGSNRIAFGYQALELTPGTRSTARFSVKSLGIARFSIIESASEPLLRAILHPW